MTYFTDMNGIVIGKVTRVSLVTEYLFVFVPGGVLVVSGRH